jgi:hypothetical protein
MGRHDGYYASGGAEDKTFRLANSAEKIALSTLFANAV